MANLSDDIERYIKAYLQGMDEVELRRNEIASQFDCVPSQINYVINTRFTIPKGYVVESKRGGSGYIRISKLQIQDEGDLLDLLKEQILDEMTPNQTRQYLVDLHRHGLLSKRESQLLLLVLTSPAISENAQGNCWRSEMLKAITDQLRVLWD